MLRFLSAHSDGRALPKVPGQMTVTSANIPRDGATFTKMLETPNSSLVTVQCASEQSKVCSPVQAKLSCKPLEHRALGHTGLQVLTGGNAPFSVIIGGVSVCIVSAEAQAWSAILLMEKIQNPGGSWGRAFSYCLGKTNRELSSCPGRWGVGVVPYTKGRRTEETSLQHIVG